MDLCCAQTEKLYTIGCGCVVQCVKDSLNDDHHRYLALALAHSNQEKKKKNSLCYVPFHRISFAK